MGVYQNKSMLETNCTILSIPYTLSLLLTSFLELFLSEKWCISRYKYFLLVIRVRNKGMIVSYRYLFLTIEVS